MVNLVNGVLLNAKIKRTVQKEWRGQLLPFLIG